MRKQLLSVIVTTVMAVSYLPVIGYAEDTKTAEECLTLYHSMENMNTIAGVSHYMVLKKNGTVWTYGFSWETERLFQTTFQFR